MVGLKIWGLFSGKIALGQRILGIAVFHKELTAVGF
jgi:hypothetical protein